MEQGVDVVMKAGPVARLQLLFLRGWFSLTRGARLCEKRWWPPHVGKSIRHGMRELDFTGPVLCLHTQVVNGQFEIITCNEKIFIFYNHQIVEHTVVIIVMEFRTCRKEFFPIALRWRNVRVSLCRLCVRLLC